MASPRSQQKKPRTILASETIAESFPPESSVLIGLSGGADSVAILLLLSEIASRRDLTLCACHVNHLLRGAESDRDAEFCEELCDRLQIPFVEVKIDVGSLAAEQKMGLEEAGRVARHFAFANIAEDEECDLIALGHHADDQVETILFRLFRGSGPDGLAGIPFRRGKIIRPLLSITRKQILSYLKRRRVSYREDESNADEVFSRNFIRHSVLPLLETRFPATRQSILRLAEIESAETQALAEIARRESAALFSESPGGTISCRLSSLQSKPLWLRRRLLRLALEKADQSPSEGLLGVDFATIERSLEIIGRGSGGATLTGGLRLKIDRDKVFISCGSGVKLKKRQVGLGDKLELAEISSFLSIKPLAADKVSLTRQKNGWRVHLAGCALQGQLIVRSVKPGDRFRPLGMKGTRLVNDLFTDQKTPTPLRGEIPLVCDEKGIVWVAGFQIAERVKLPGGKKAQRQARPVCLEIIRRRKKQ